MRQHIFEHMRKRALAARTRGDNCFYVSPQWFRLYLAGISPGYLFCREDLDAPHILVFGLAMIPKDT